MVLAFYGIVSRWIFVEKKWVAGDVAIETYDQMLSNYFHEIVNLKSSALPVNV
jgi:hypothetical protein